MSSSTQIVAGIVEPAPENRDFVDGIAFVVSKQWPTLEGRIKANHEIDPKFSFLWSSDPCHAYYRRKVTEYLAQPDAHESVLDAPPTPECVHDAPLAPPSRYSHRTPYRDPGFKFPAGMTPHDLGVIKLTALFLARWGPYFLLALWKRVDDNPQFDFLKSPGSILKFYRGLVGAYARVFIRSEKVPIATLLKVFFHKVEMSTVMLHAFVGGVDSFVHMENLDYFCVMPPPERLSMTVDRLKHMRPPLVSDTPFSSYSPDSLSMEHGIINLTAQFVARYGPYFCRELKKAVEKKPQFEFMKPADGMYHYYSRRVDVYSKVFEDLERLGKGEASTAAAYIEVLFQRLQLEKLEARDEAALNDLHALVSGVIYCFADMEDENYSGSLLSQDRPSIQRSTPLGSKLTEYGAENQDVQDIHECDVRPVPSPKWDPPLRRTSFVLGLHVREFSLKELGIIKLTAQFVARYGPYFCRDLMKTVDKNPQFEFMKPLYRKFDFYNGLAASYATVLRRSRRLRYSDASTGTVLDDFFHHLQLEMLDEGVEMAIGDLHAFVGGVDCFAYMENLEYSTNLPPPEPFSVIMNRVTKTQPGSQLTEYLAQNQDGAQPDGPATHECVGDARLGLEPPPMEASFRELGVIKLTAQFVARYGYLFSEALMKREDKNPQFEFMKPAYSRSYNLFHELVNAYRRVLKTSDQLSDASTAETFIEVFLQRLQLKELEQGVEMAMIDLQAFVRGVDCFADMDVGDRTYLPPPERLSVMINRLTQMQPGHPRPYDQLALRVPGKSIPGTSLPLPEEPEPKRQKF
ncbi:unnamed protein product [Arabis nemorensis]|uniref:SURP motif domain-containing protein n=1 Tax=Arabis nemorensis TaxID=586526 RepID=A0A565CKB7_9BRAS|nr:unnamed protein product [Arabis nemorensis]